MRSGPALSITPGGPQIASTAMNPRIYDGSDRTWRPGPALARCDDRGRLAVHVQRPSRGPAEATRCATRCSTAGSAGATSCDWPPTSPSRPMPEGRFVFVAPDPALGWPAATLLGQPAELLLAEPAGDRLQPVPARRAGAPPPRLAASGRTAAPSASPSPPPRCSTPQAASSAAAASAQDIDRAGRHDASRSPPRCAAARCWTTSSGACARRCWRRA